MMQAAGEPATTIDEPYLLTLNIALIRRSDGRYFADPSWAKDLLLHTEYLTALTLVCPYRDGEPPATWREISSPGLRISAYRTTERGVGQYWAMTRLAARLLAEVPRARIVHAGVAGYPIPTGWLAVPIARLLGKAIVIPVESAFWRLPHGAPAGRAARLKAAAWERINRYCLRQADYASYSHDRYRRTLPSPRAGGGELFQASWIDDEVVLSADAVAARHRSHGGGALRYLFATRMIAEKGTAILAESLASLAAQNAELTIDILGEGTELDRLRQAARTPWGERHVRILNPVPYGPVFFDLLGRYDAVLVPSLSDEQPRIIYDAYSQGVTTIASDTPGTQACVQHGGTGTLIPPGDATALTAALMTADRGSLQEYGRAGRDLAARHTHRGMHRQRAAGLRRMLERSGG